MIDGRVVSIALLAAIAAGALSRAFVHQPRPLAERVRPHVAGHRHRFGTSRGLAPSDDPAGESGVMLVFGPLIRQLADALAGLVDATGSATAELRLKQAGLDLSVEQYRARQLAYAVVGFGGGALLGVVIGTRTGVVVLLAGAGGVWGATRWRARLERMVTKRRERMRAEMYTVCQLLAIYLRTGDTPAGAVDRLVRRSSGEIVGELTDASAQIRTGSSPASVFEQLTARTPEPSAARLYRLLASTWTAGGDDDALFALGEDVRAARREDLGRLMAKRETAMALPLVLVIGPILILFVAAAIPHLVFGR